MKYLILVCALFLSGCNSESSKPFSCEGRVGQIDTDRIRVDCNDGQSFNVIAGKYWITIERIDK